MEWRNAKFNENGTIDCEIDHPEYGWIPFTATPDDVEESGRAIFAELKDKAEAFVPPAAEVALERSKVLAVRELVQEAEAARIKSLEDGFKAELDTAKSVTEIAKCKANIKARGLAK